MRIIFSEQQLKLIVLNEKVARKDEDLRRIASEYDGKPLNDFIKERNNEYITMVRRGPCVDNDTNQIVPCYNNKGAKCNNCTNTKEYFNDLTKNMVRTISTDYTDDEIIKLASKFKNKSKFAEENRSAHIAAIYRGPCKDRTTGEIVPCKSYNKELKRTAPCKNCFNTYEFYNSITSGMTVTCYGDRMVYAHEFYDENENPVAAYIGLTANEDRRKEEHLTGIGFTGKEQLSKVTKFLKENPSLHHSYKKLSDYVDCENAQKLESDYVNEYRNNGWQILNVAKTGGLGGYKKNTKEFLKKKVNIWIKNKTDNGQTPYITLFKKEEPKLYSTIIINKAGDYCFDNLITKEQEILDIAKKCVSYQEFRNKYENTYFLKAKRYGILDDVKKLFV